MLRSARYLERDRVEPIALANVKDSDTINNTTTETAFSIAGAIQPHVVRDGAVFRIFASGRFSTAPSGPTLRIRVSLGGVEVFDSGAVSVSGSITNAQWRVTLMCGYRDGVIKVFVQEALIGNSTLEREAQDTGVLNWRRIQEITVTAEWGTAAVTNATTLEAFVVEQLA